MFTAEPRAIVTFRVVQGVVSLKPATDQQNVLVAIDLPFQFAYRMLELNAVLIQNTADDWLAVAMLEITNAIRSLPLGSVTRHPVPVSQTVRRNTTLLWMADMSVPKYIMQSIAPGIAPTITFEAGNNDTAAATAGTLDFYASFLEYEIEQVQMYPIHYPSLTLER